MKNEFLKRLGISVCVLSMVLSSSVMASEKTTNNQNNQSNIQIMLFNVSYTLSNFQVSGTTSFDYSISLSNSELNGKVHYVNNGSENVTLYVKSSTGNVDSVSISPNSDDYITWEKTTYGDKSYTVGIKNSGSTNLNGKISLAKSNETHSKVDISMGGKSNSYKETWDQTSGYEWARVYINNTSNVGIYYSIDNYINDYLEPNDDIQFKVHPLSSGQHYINLEGENGSDITGWFGVRESDSED